MRTTRGGLVATAVLLLVRETMSSAGGGGSACNNTAGDDVVRRQPRQVAHVDHLALPHSGSTTVATALRRALEARALRGAASCAKCSGAACGPDALLPVRATLVYRAGHAHFPLAERRDHIASDWADGAVSRAREASGGARQAEHEKRMGLRGPSPRIARPGAVVTVHVLREPVTWLWRTLMRFSYMPVEGAARRGSRTASGATLRGRARGEPVSAWLDRNPFAWNMQAQFLAGRPRFDCNRTLAAARNDADPEGLLPRAEAELADETALAFGLFERLEDSAGLIAHALCLPKATLVAGVRRGDGRRPAVEDPRGAREPRPRRAPPRAPRGPRRGAGAAGAGGAEPYHGAVLDADERARIAARMRLDRELYGYAARLFDDRVARMRRDEAAGATCRPGGDAACALRCS